MGRQWLAALGPQDDPPDPKPSAQEQRLLDADVLLGVGGFTFPYDGLAEAWIRLTDAGKAKPIKLVRHLRRVLQQFIAEHRPRRIQATVIETLHRVGERSGLSVLTLIT